MVTDYQLDSACLVVLTGQLPNAQDYKYFEGILLLGHFKFYQLTRVVSFLFCLFFNLEHFLIISE